MKTRKRRLTNQDEPKLELNNPCYFADLFSIFSRIGPKSLRVGSLPIIAPGSLLIRWLKENFASFGQKTMIFANFANFSLYFSLFLEQFLSCCSPPKYPVILSQGAKRRGRRTPVVSLFWGYTNTEIALSLIP